MLIKKQHIDELYELKNRNNNYTKGYNYFDNILKKTISPFAFFNTDMEKFILFLQPLVAHLYDTMNISKNYKRWYSDKYKNDHVR